MIVFVQWALANPQDWESLEAIDWPKLPSKPEPIGGEKLDDVPGWVCDLNVQGNHFSGADHYHVEDLGDHIRVTAWADDLNDYLPSQLWAVVYDIYNLSPDASKGGAINTKIRMTRYLADPIRSLQKIETADGSNVPTFPYDTFDPPKKNVLHGIWLDQELLDNHRKAQSFKAWWSKEWTSHLAPTELDADGDLLPQREQGKYLPNRSTITWYWTSNNRAVGTHIATQEKALERSVGSGSLTVTIPASQNDYGLTLTTPANDPNVASWPNGDYRFQCDISSIGADLFIDCTGSSNRSHVARVNSALSSEVGTNETWSPLTNVAATGLSLRTVTWNTVPGTTQSDVFAVDLGIDNGSMMTAEDIVFTLDSDAFVDGPWTSGATPVSALPADDVSGVLADVFAGQFRFRAAPSENLET